MHVIQCKVYEKKQKQNDIAKRSEKWIWNWNYLNIKLTKLTKTTVIYFESIFTSTICHIYQYISAESLLNNHNSYIKRAFAAMETDQNSSINLMSIRFDLSIGNRVVVQHSLEVGPIGREMWKQDSFNSLQTEKQTTNYLLICCTGHRRLPVWERADVKSGPLGPEQWTYLPAQGMKSYHCSIVRAQWSDWIRQDLLEWQQNLMVKTTNQIPVNPGKQQQQIL